MALDEPWPGWGEWVAEQDPAFKAHHPNHFRSRRAANMIPSARNVTGVALPVNTISNSSIVTAFYWEKDLQNDEESTERRTAHVW